jgi:hypothetical protein
MEKELIPYDQALSLKELGFDEPCLIEYEIHNNKLFIEFYEDGITNSKLHQITDELNEDQIRFEEELYNYSYAIPLYQQAFRWFREKHDLHCNIDPWGYCIFDDNGTEKTGFESYEEAQLECLKKLIEIVK